MKDFVGLGHLFVSAFLFHFSSYMVIPAITDVTMEAVCPGRDECSLAIYLTGFHHATIGLGALLVTPLIGNLSDKHGRKALLTLPTTLAIVPLAILAYDRSKVYFYAYYVVKIVAGTFCEGSMQCLSLAYVADKVVAGRRTAAFGLLSGISGVGFVSGTLAARFLTTSSTFQVSAASAMAAAIYLRIFLSESGGADLTDKDSCGPLLCSSSCTDEESSPKLPLLKRKLPSIPDMVALLTSSFTVSTAAMVTFFYSLGESGLSTALLYYLKAQFHFSKDEYANLLLIVGIAGMFSQLTLMPFLASTVGEEKLLIVGLLGACAHVFLYGIAWAYWVAYLSAAIVILSVFVHPCIRSIVSRNFGPTEQGMAQGCISGISSFGNILGPLVFTPLTAWFLSETAPFDFKGFSLLCAGLCIFVGFLLSIKMSTRLSTEVKKLNSAGDDQA